MTMSRDNGLAPDEARRILTEAGLRATRQRLAMIDILFGQPPAHVSAEGLYDEVCRRGAPGSLSQVYGSLKHFCASGLMRRVPIYGNTAWYELRGEDHHHFYVEDEDRLLDIPPDLIRLGDLPPPPPGYVLSGVDILCRIRRDDAPDQRS
ncbi:Fur family transcriptional regulator [Paenirhodobacter sp.]|uniref:Fur family transcriptional regulator n=1 Tax=Paenirhodobacter sp. TaxID=1965326 RepID=UPI003B3E008B